MWYVSHFWRSLSPTGFFGNFQFFLVVFVSVSNVIMPKKVNFFLIDNYKNNLQDTSYIQVEPHKLLTNLISCFISYFTKKPLETAHACLIFCNSHCMKSVQIRSFFWSVFSRIRTEYGEIQSISRHSASFRIQSECGKIWTRKNSIFVHLSRSVLLQKCQVCFNLGFDSFYTCQITP